MQENTNEGETKLFLWAGDKTMYKYSLVSCGRKMLKVIKMKEKQKTKQLEKLNN